MKKILSLFTLIFAIAYFGSINQIDAETEPLGHWIDVYDGHQEPQYAVCAGSGEDCITNDVKDYPDPPIPILT